MNFSDFPCVIFLGPKCLDTPQLYANPVNNSPYTTKSVHKFQVPSFKTKTNFYKNPFFPEAIIEWNDFDVNIRNPASN